MGLREKIDERIRRKEQEIAGWENSIREARAYIQGLQDTMKLLPREDARTAVAATTLRPNSVAYKAMEALRAVEQPLHITDILKSIGMVNTKANRILVGGTLSRYVRSGQIFVKTAPNTFTVAASAEGPEPPNDFGAMPRWEEEESVEER